MSESERSDSLTWDEYLRRFIAVGYLCLIVSSACLYFSIQEQLPPGEDYNTLNAMLMMCARLAGLTAFFIGALSLYNKKFGHGTILFVTSNGLPIISLYFNGYM